MGLRVLLLVGLIGCHDWKWVNIPEGLKLTCGDKQKSVMTCAGSDDRLYTCIKDYDTEEIACVLSPGIQ